MNKEKGFSKWTKWSDRDYLEGIKFPGVYCIAVSEKDISDTPFDWIKDICYIGMTYTGLRGRLSQFNNTINDKLSHGGADRFKYAYHDYDKVVDKLYVSVKYFVYNVKEVTPENLIFKGEILKHEYVCFAQYMEKHNELPRFNRMDAEKYSKIEGKS